MLQVDPLGLARRWKPGGELIFGDALGAIVSAGIEICPFLQRAATRQTLNASLDEVNAIPCCQSDKVIQQQSSRGEGVVQRAQYVTLETIAHLSEIVSVGCATRTSVAVRALVNVCVKRASCNRTTIER